MYSPSLVRMIGHLSAKRVAFYCRRFVDLVICYCRVSLLKIRFFGHLLCNPFTTEVELQDKSVQVKSGFCRLGCCFLMAIFGGFIVKIWSKTISPINKLLLK